MATIREKVRQLIDQIDNARAAGSVTNRMLASVLNYFFGDKDVFEELDNKADKKDVYTKTETDTKLSNKADKNSVYTKTEVDTKFAKRDQKEEEIRGVITKYSNIIDDYLSSMGGYCNTGEVIISSSNYFLYLYLLRGGKEYKFQKVNQAEGVQRLVFTIDSQSDFAVGGAVKTIIVKGSDPNGDYFYTPESDTYVVVNRNRQNPETIYISAVEEDGNFYDFSEYEPKNDYDDVPTKNSSHAIKSNGVYLANVGINDDLGIVKYITDITLVNNPARQDGTSSSSEYFKGYEIDLSNYANSLYSVVFRGSCYDNKSDIVGGIILDSDNNVESFVRTDKILTNDILILPLTNRSRKLWATYCVSSTGGEKWVPTNAAIVRTGVLKDITNLKPLVNSYTFQLLQHAEKLFPIDSPAYKDNSTALNGSYKGYTVDVSNLYNKGVRGVLFRGSATSPKAENKIVPGIVVDSDGIESYVATFSDFSSDWHILPITANSITLHASYCYSNQYVTTPKFTPELVYFVHDDYFKLLNRVNSVEEIIGEISFPNTYLPSKIYGVIGDTLQIFNRGVVIAVDPYKFYNKFTCGQGKVYDRYIEITPALVNGSVPNNLTIKHKLIDNYYNESNERSSQFVISARPTSSPINNINVLCIGASTTEGGQWASELKRRLTGTLDTGSPAADGLSNISFVGRKQSSGVHLEATGGWNWNTFYTPQTALRFTVTNVSSVNIGSVYSFIDGNGKTVNIQVAEVNVTGSTGNIRFLYNYNTQSRGVPTSQSGSLTKQSGSGDDTITFTSYTQESYCPFYDENLHGASFSNYANMYCDGKIDVAIFYLGNINAGIIGKVNLSVVISQMKTLLDALHRDFPNCKAIIGTPMGVNQYHGVEYNYGASSNYTQWSVLYGAFRYAAAIEEFISQDGYKDWCFLANLLGETDSENVFPTTEKNVNNRMTKKEIIGTNGVHPDNPGYMMAADCFYRCFVNTILT